MQAVTTSVHAASRRTAHTCKDDHMRLAAQKRRLACYACVGGTEARVAGAARVLLRCACVQKHSFAAGVGRASVLCSARVAGDDVARILGIARAFYFFHCASVSELV